MDWCYCLHKFIKDQLFFLLFKLVGLEKAAAAKKSSLLLIMRDTATKDRHTNKLMNKLYKKAKIIALTVSILTAYFSFALPDEIFSYIENSEVKLGVITNYGAVIGYFSEISPVNNFINYVDAGREIQQSYYGWDDGSSWAGGDWVWNPVQGGNSVGDKPRLLVFSNENNRIYSKSNPRNWAGGELITDCVMEEWISLSGNVAHIIFKMTYTGPSNAPNAYQELPAVFVVKEYENLTFYGGPMAWTEGSLTNFKPGFNNGYDHRYEQWSAYVNNSGWGMGVYTPGTTYQTRYWRDGTGGNEGWGCSYFAPVKGLQITNNFSYQYDVYLTIGMTNEIRESFDEVRKSKFKYEPLPGLENSEFEKPVIPWVTTSDVIDDWNNGSHNMLQYGPSISPITGQSIFFNGAESIFQSLPGGTLQPDTTYQLTFDALTIAGQPSRTIHAGIMFGLNNGPLATIQNTNIENFAISSGSWLGAGWPGGGQFTTIVNPPANDPAITHTLMFDTPVSNIVGNYLTEDLTVAIWYSSGIQVQVDNVSITNYPRNRSMAALVNNGTFDSPVATFNTSTNAINGWNNAVDCGVINAAIVGPLSGQCAYFNGTEGCVQTFPGIKLQPNMYYKISFDSLTVNGSPIKTIKAGLGHARFFEGDSRFICPIDDDNVMNVNQGSGEWLGDGWASGALFTNVLNPSANDPAISHVFSFSTPDTLTGNKLAFDLGIKLWDVDGAQVKLDNLVVTNFVVPEPCYLLLIIGNLFFIFRWKNKFNI